MDAKQLGCSDKQLSSILGVTEDDACAKRNGAGITPYKKQIDNLTTEYPVDINYLYMAYHASEHV